MNRIQVRKTLRLGAWLCGFHCVLILLMLVFQVQLKALMGYGYDGEWVFLPEFLLIAAEDVSLMIYCRALGDSLSDRREQGGTSWALVWALLLSKIPGLVYFLLDCLAGVYPSGITDYSPEALATMGLLSVIDSWLSLPSALACILLMAGVGYSLGRNGGGKIIKALALSAVGLTVLEAGAELFTLSSGSYIGEIPTLFYNGSTYLYSKLQMFNWVVNILMGLYFFLVLRRVRKGYGKGKWHLFMICGFAALIVYSKVFVFYLGYNLGLSGGGIIKIPAGSILYYAISQARRLGGLALNFIYLGAGVFLGEQRRLKITCKERLRVKNGPESRES